MSITALITYHTEQPAEAEVQLFEKSEKAIDELRSKIMSESYDSGHEDADDYLSRFGIVTNTGIMETSEYQAGEDFEDKMTVVLDNMNDKQLVEFYNNVTSGYCHASFHVGMSVQK